MQETKKSINFDDQFRFPKSEILSKYFDYSDWFRFYPIVKDAIDMKSQHILEIGAGGGTVRDLLVNNVEEYITLDINPNLKPDIVGNITDWYPSLVNRFDLIICTEVLEHIDFDAVVNVLRDVYCYLVPKGKLIITVPHQRLYFMWMIPTNKPYTITMPRLFMSKRIDPYHKWEIDGNVSQKEVERMFIRASLKKRVFRKILSNDYWILEKV